MYRYTKKMKNLKFNILIKVNTKLSSLVFFFSNSSRCYLTFYATGDKINGFQCFFFFIYFMNQSVKKIQILVKYRLLHGIALLIE